MTESFYKHINLLKSGYSFLQSSLTGKAEIKGMPVSIGIELTNNCNLKCPQCCSGSGRMVRKRGYMDVELFRKVMTELTPYLYNVNLFFQGEPMLHPQFFSFLNYCNEINSVVSTNGHFLSAENSEKLALSGLNKLIISLDGIDQKTYSVYRVNGNAEKVIEGIRNVTRAREKRKSELKIEIQFLVNSFNEHQISSVKRLAKNTGAGFQLKSMQIINREDIDNWLPSEGRFRRYKIKNGEYVLKSSLPNRCARLWFNPVITWDGKVVPCCFDKNAEHIMGDLNQDSFREIWEGPKYRIFRKSILMGRHMIEMCRNCTSGLKGVEY